MRTCGGGEEVRKIGGEDGGRGESDNSPKFSGGSHDTQSGTGLIDWVLD